MGIHRVFVAKANDPGDALIYSTFVPERDPAIPPSGGDGVELYGPAIALETEMHDPNGPGLSPNAYVAVVNGGAFVAKLDPTPPPQLVADAGPDQIVEATSPTAATVTLDGTGSINPNPDDGELAFIWTEINTPNNTPPRTFFESMPDVEFPIGTTEVELFVAELANPDTPTATDTVVITVTPRQHNGLPVADAGPDQTCILQEGEGETCQVTLDGSGTTD